ncbi:alpha/beta hydrolase [Amnibacterium kyonggiense]|uniref:alpha/beta hydrolase n=1 Tax=Amnibacterium kyonggiense TaxID=595671 RepID=UPI0013C2C953|nr:alpha/beta hydrolase-fold protein [Amnibacterium kyonggiense]
MHHLPAWIGAAAAVVIAAAGVALIAVLLRRRRRLAASFTVGATLALVAVTVVASVGVHGLGAQPTGTPVALATSRSAPATSVPPPPVVTTATWRPSVLHGGIDYARIARVHVPVFPRALRGDVVRKAHELPAHGLVGSVRIPGTVSHYAARAAVIYLPPAALVPQPRLLPLVVMFSGQSRGAGPYDPVWDGDLGPMMDAIAARHHGVAPIVVVPDQLGSFTGNPMCVDSPLGHVAAYVMHDVRAWVLRHLPVETDRTTWTVAGFSEGGTCSIQFASEHPDVFGSFVDVSGERAPLSGTLEHSIAAGFHGDARAYEHAGPIWVMAHRTYSDEEAYFAVGALDRQYGPVMPVMAAHAAAAGMVTHQHRVSALSHNWRMADLAFTWGFHALEARWRL